MGTATSSTSLLGRAGRNGAYIQLRPTAPVPSWGLQLCYGFYPFPVVVGQLERRRGRTGNLGVLQMRCSHDHSPILTTPKGATGNRLDAEGEHLWILDLLLISATWGQCCVEQGGCLGDGGPHCCKAYPASCALGCLCWGELLNYFPLGTVFTHRPYFYPGIKECAPTAVSLLEAKPGVGNNVQTSSIGESALPPR